MNQTPDPRTVRYNRIIFVLSVLGLMMAIYVLQSFLRQSPVICLTGDGCDLVRKSPLSYPLGIPVPAFGLVGYLGLLVLSFMRTMSWKMGLLKAMLGIALFGVTFVSWFTWTELALIGGVCMWCAISAVNMYIIFFLILASFRVIPKEVR